jgi:threonylcarbamoyladenosine tRNA methylthiotransferase MtaB
VVGPGEVADLFVFNTCAVTHLAARKSRKLIRNLRRANPDAPVIVTGCYAELSPAEVEALGVDLVVGNRDKDELPSLLEGEGLLRDADPIPEVDATPFPAPHDPAARTRAFVKVQDGCDNRCTFCIVTVARGEARSRAQSQVVDQVRELVDAGYQEAVLSGVHLGAYGHERPDEGGLQALIRRILAETDVPRLRLSSLEPWDLSGDFFELWEDPRLLPHLHLPLQSGCDATLQRMARRTTQQQFANLVADARSAIPDLAVTTDVMVGFPGETDAEFADSVAFVEGMEFAKLHVFRYSPREGTVAASMPEQVTAQVAQLRSQRLHLLGAEMQQAYQRRFLGREMEVLWETPEVRESSVAWSGLTGNYLRVVTETAPDADLGNKVLEARLTGEIPGGLAAQTAYSNG